jgi:serine phosphatase RsbU (regulator of sigma subunit)
VLGQAGFAEPKTQIARLSKMSKRAGSGKEVGSLSAEDSSSRKAAKLEEARRKNKIYRKQLKELAEQLAEEKHRNRAQVQVILNLQRENASLKLDQHIHVIDNQFQKKTAELANELLLGTKVRMSSVMSEAVELLAKKMVEVRRLLTTLAATAVGCGEEGTTATIRRRHVCK